MTQRYTTPGTDQTGCSEPPSPPIQAAARVRVLAERMRERCLRLDEISAGMGAQTVDEAPDAIVLALAQREPLVRELAGLGDELAAILNDPGAVRELGEHEHRQIRARMGELEQVMARIRERDRETRATLQRRRDGLADQIASVNIHRGAARAYSGGNHPVNPTVQDGLG
ncbi:MAG: hypothetical protein AAGA55_03890 [Planctomycetota bacterium]